MNIKKDIIIEGIIEITKEKNFAKVETEQDNKDYRLEHIVVKALGDALPEGYGQQYAGSIRVTIELQSNSIAVNKGDSLTNKTEYKPVVMKETEDEILP